MRLAMIVLLIIVTCDLVACGAQSVRAPLVAFTVTPSPLTPLPGDEGSETPLGIVASTPTSLPGGEGSETDMVWIPAGEFTMGGSAEAEVAVCKALWYKPDECKREMSGDEEPQHTVYVDEFWIDKYEVTNAQYMACVKAGKCTEPHEKSSLTRDSYYDNAEFAHYPVMKIDWTQAKGYCEYASKRLPTEAEWEKAARGTDGRIYPWGNEFDGAKLNFCDKNCQFDWANKSYDDGYADTSPVGSYELGQSPYGVFDMAGNVWEWTSSDYRPYPYKADDGREEGLFYNYKTLRGGSWLTDGFNVRLTHRYFTHVTHWGHFMGVRCAR